MSAIEQFRLIAAEPRFQGWPLIGEIKKGVKIPFFGETIEYQLQTGNGVEDYTSLLRRFGWVVCFGITRDLKVITGIQWKPGINRAEWDFPPGGIGRVSKDTSQEEILTRSQEAYLRETGYGNGEWTYLGHVMIDSGKFRGADPDDHGFPAYMYLATGLEKVSEARKPNPNEIIETLLVPLEEFPDVAMSAEFDEASGKPCALMALKTLGMFQIAPRDQWLV